MMNALAIFRGGVWVHDAPALSAPSKFMTTVPDAAGLVGLSSIPDAQGYRWLHIQFDDGRGDGYVREDVTYVIGDISLWGGGKLADPAIARTAIPGASGAVAAPQPPASAPQAPPASAGKWPAPCPGIPVFLPYGANEGGGIIHAGTDLSKAGILGLPIRMYGGGEVWQINRCTKCAGGAGSVMQSGYALNDARVLNDPGFQYGFGNETIFHYAYNQVPTDAQAAMQAAGFAGGHAFVVIAHQNAYAADLKLGPFTAPADGKIVGYVGQSGNASGAHVHIEVRLHTSANPASLWDNVAKTVDPATFYAL